MSTTYTQSLAASASRTSGISSQTIATAHAYLGSAIDNATNLDPYADIEAVWSYGSAPTVSKTVKIHLLWSQDATNYEEGSDSGTETPPLPGCLVAVFSPPADTSTHRKLFQGIPLSPYKFKAFVENVDTAQTITITLNISTRSDKAVG